MHYRIEKHDDEEWSEEDPDMTVPSAVVSLHDQDDFFEERATMRCREVSSDGGDFLIQRISRSGQKRALPGIMSILKPTVPCAAPGSIFFAPSQAKGMAKINPASK